jgi:hypothetical protein
MGNANILWENVDTDRDVNLIAGFLVYNTRRKQLSIDPDRLASNKSFYGMIDKWLRSPESEDVFETDLVQQRIWSESQRGAISADHSRFSRDISVLIISIADNDPANYRDGIKAGLRLDCLATPLQIEAFTVPSNLDSLNEVSLVPLDINHREYVKIMDRRAFIFAAMLRAVANKFITQLRK